MHIFILSFAILLSAGCSREEEVIDLKLYDDASGNPRSSYEETDDVPGGGDEEKPGEVTVYVCGAVRNPGVYTLKEDARAVDAIDAAMGMCANADREYINQAMLLEDGQKIYVPTHEETRQRSGDIAVEGQGGEAGNGRVNINTAGADELMTLPGIGEAKAALIIEYRNSNGSFKKIEDIMQISGIKEGMFNRIRDRICI